MQTIEIRKIEHGDYDNLSALAIQVWLNTYASNGIRDKISSYVLREFSPQRFKALKESPAYQLYLAFKESHLVGFITIDLASRYKLSNSYGHEIKTLYIHHRFQKQGIGTLLVNATQKECGYSFWLTTWIHNEPAIKFYTHIGFQQVGTTQFDLLGESHTNFVFSNSKTVQDKSKITSE